MARRPDPQRLHEARRDGTLRRLETYGEMSAERAEAWLCRWEADEAPQSLERDSRYWDAGWDWIAAALERDSQP
jgi:hypothetical protein